MYSFYAFAAKGCPSVYVSMCDCMLKVRECSILPLVRMYPNLQLRWVQMGHMNRLDFGSKGQRLERYHLYKSALFWQRRTYRQFASEDHLVTLCSWLCSSVW